MGSIDENALSSLSFVSSLSKHIKVKSTTDSGEPEEDDPESLRKYMPKFMWVVRDFSLQLMDDQNEEITPRQYLERALQDQLDPSKNQIK